MCVWATVPRYGCGKRALLRIIAGVERSDDGHIATNPDARLGYLAQGFTANPELPLQQLLVQVAGDDKQLERKIQHRAGALSKAPENIALQDAYDLALHRLSKLDPGRRQFVLEALGLDNVPLSQRLGNLSGGQKPARSWQMKVTLEQRLLHARLGALQMIRRVAPMDETEARPFLHFFLFSGDDSLRPGADLSFGERARLALALLVAGGSNFLLLDEPLKRLDVPSRSPFEEALAGFDGPVLAVVHDRTSIETFATEIWEVRGDQI